MQWSTNSNNGWYLIDTVESYNGRRDGAGGTQGDFIEWFSSNAFGGSGYANTPVGAVTYVTEPNGGQIVAPFYFALWAAGKNSGICAWNALPNVTRELQVVGDPLVVQ